MSFPAELTSLVLYVVQQIGVVLAVGAETILLVGFLVSNRDNTFSTKETYVGKIATYTLRMGLVFVVLSGLCTIAFHVVMGQEDIISSPAFIFKWGLIILLTALTIHQGREPFAKPALEGFAGANWYALFVLHMVAPVTIWTDLLVVYGGWIPTFMVVWSSLVYALQGKTREDQIAAELQKIPTLTRASQPPLGARPMPHMVVPAPAMPVRMPAPPPLKPKVAVAPPPPPQPVVAAVVALPPPPPIPVPPPPPLVAAVAPRKPAQLPEALLNKVAFPAPHKPVVAAAPVPLKPPPVPAPTPAPVPTPPPVVAMAVPQKPPVAITEDTIESEESTLVHAIRVMPRTPEEIQFQYRPSTVQFSQS